MDSTAQLVLGAPTLVPHRSPIDAAHVRSLIDACADAGFSGMSIWTDHHDWAVADGMGSEEFFDYHRERGLTMPAAEIVLEWATRDQRAVAQANTHMLDVTARAGASTILAARLEPDLPPLTEAAAGLAALCDLAAERGLTVSFEFLPWSGVPNIATALRLLEAADRDNLGLVIDTWHWSRQRGGPDFPTLRRVPGERIHFLQLNDAPIQPGEDLIMESGDRLLPGEGAVDILGLLDALEEIHAAPLVGAEVFSRYLMSLGAAENARRQYAAATAVLAEHRARRDRESEP